MPSNNDLNPEQIEHIAALNKRIEGLQSYILDCERRIYGGETPDLSGLDENVAILCRDITALPASSAYEFLSKLESLIQSTDRLNEALND